MVTQKNWEEFRTSGLLWWINTMLHMFGWAIVYEFGEDDGELQSVYPARVKYRGFDADTNDQGYQKVTKYLKDTIEELEKETLS